ncbi:hypothetical protein ACF1DY_26685 [Streptomyces albus]|uniref:hypothetical protein n=1 Tax=Streptomyces albus TaxID=1888 RepID=UPI0036F9A5EE
MRRALRSAAVLAVLGSAYLMCSGTAQAQSAPAQHAQATVHEQPARAAAPVVRTDADGQPDQVGTDEVTVLAAPQFAQRMKW